MSSNMAVLTSTFLCSSDVYTVDMCFRPPVVFTLCVLVMVSFWFGYFMARHYLLCSISSLLTCVPNETSLLSDGCVKQDRSDDGGPSISAVSSNTAACEPVVLYTYWGKLFHTYSACSNLRRRNLEFPLDRSTRTIAMRSGRRPCPKCAPLETGLR